jgi:hypothetical protein
MIVHHVCQVHLVQHASGNVPLGAITTFAKRKPETVFADRTLQGQIVQNVFLVNLVTRVKKVVLTIAKTAFVIKSQVNVMSVLVKI